MKTREKQLVPIQTAIYIGKISNALKKNNWCLIQAAILYISNISNACWNGSMQDLNVYAS